MDAGNILYQWDAFNAGSNYRLNIGTASFAAATDAKNKTYPFSGMHVQQSGYSVTRRFQVWALYR